MQFYSNTNFYWITHSHRGRALSTSTYPGTESAAGKILKGHWNSRDKYWMIYCESNEGCCLQLNVGYKMSKETDRETPGWNARCLGIFSNPPLPQVQFVLPFLFPFFNERQDRDRINGPKRKKTQNDSLAAFSTKWNECDVEDSGRTGIDLFIWRLSNELRRWSM